MSDHQDYADLGALLSQPEQWSDAVAERARLLRDGQAQAATDCDQRDGIRVTAMWRVVRQLDEALAAFRRHSLSAPLIGMSGRLGPGESRPRA